MKLVWILRILRGLQIVGLCLFLSACADTGQTTKNVPSPTPLATGGPSPLPAPAPTVDSRLPDLSRAVGINLTDALNFSALRAMATNVFPPLVGNPLLSLALSATRDRSISGSLLFAFEDQYGFWGAQAHSFPLAGYHDDKTVDIIFADDSLVLRVAATRVIDNLTGTLYYRMRQAGDTACRTQIVTCTSWGFSGGFPSPLTACPATLQTPDTVIPCQVYMSPLATQVKSVGTFSAKFSTWASQ